MANLTQEDFDALRDLIKLTIDESLEDKLTEKLGAFPTKDEFYQETAKLYKKMQDMEESIDILNHQTSEIQIR